MSIKVRYFASLKDKLGRSEDNMTMNDCTTVSELWHRANPEKALPQNTLVAINLDYADLNSVVNDGDEVAFFPPVTGG